MFYSDNNSSNALQALIIDTIKAQQLSSLQIVSAMGYSKQNRSKKQRYAAIKRLHQVLGDADLLITQLTTNQLGFDSTHTSDEFVEKLCTVFDIPKEQYKPLLRKLTQKRHDLLSKPKLLLRASIAFNEAFSMSFSQTVCLSRFKSVPLPSTARMLPKNKLGIVVERAIQKHKEKYKDVLPYGGVFTGFSLSYLQA